MDGLGPPAKFDRRRFGVLYALRRPVRSTRSGLRLLRGTYIPRRGVPRNAHFGPVIFTRSRRTHCARVHCTSPPRVIFLYTSPPAVQPYLLLPSIIERFHTTCGFYNAAPARGALLLLHTHTRAPTPAAPLQVCSPASESSPFVWSSGGPLITSK